jgi:predicted RNase H-like HicB family nuclease
MVAGIMHVWYTVDMDMDQVTVAFEFDAEIETWSAHIPGVGAYGEGATKEEALADLKEALHLYMETVGKNQFLEEAGLVEYESVPLQSIAEIA